MSENYSFMKSGSSLTSSNMFNEDQIRQMLSLFISNAIINASKYCKLAKRNGITKKDINLGLKYEVREFFERTTLEQDFEEIKRDYEALEAEEPTKFKVEWVDSRTGIINESKLLETEEDAESFISDKETSEDSEFNIEFTIVELGESDIIMDRLTEEESNLEPFKEVTIEDLTNTSQEERAFVVKINKYKNDWDSWEPQTPIHTILKNAVNSMLMY
jgi:hypothetical protein